MPDPAPAIAVVVAARNEADRVGETLGALRSAMPGAALWVADDASTDGTAEAAMAAGAQVVSRGRPHGKGANVGAGAEAALSADPAPELILLCDGDLGASAAALVPLVDAVQGGGCDLAVAVIVAARNEADRVGETLLALRGAMPGAALW
ncbi:MAG TPA: glycosyltransferase, partial [Solirubrobacterales bacterium]